MHVSTQQVSQYFKHCSYRAHIQLSKLPEICASSHCNQLRGLLSVSIHESEHSLHSLPEWFLVLPATVISWGSLSLSIHESEHCRHSASQVASYSWEVHFHFQFMHVGNQFMFVNLPPSFILHNSLLYTPLLIGSVLVCYTHMHTLHTFVNQFGTSLLYTHAHLIHLCNDLSDRS